MAINKNYCYKPIFLTTMALLLLFFGQRSQGQVLPEKKDSSRYEWEIDKYNQWQERQARFLALKSDSMRKRFKNRFIIGVSTSSFFISGYAKGAADKNTGVDMAAVKKVWGGYLEYFPGQKSRIGLELQWHSAPKKFSMTTDGTAVAISGGGGNSILLFGYFKQTICNLFSGNRMENKIRMLKSDSLDEETIHSLYRVGRKVGAIPKLYGILGVGIVSTNLLRVKGGAPDNMNVKIYNQNPYAAEAGVGLFSRIGNHIFVDLACKYIISKDYSPEIGGLKSYTGIKLQLNVGWILHAGFNSLRKSNL